MPRPWTPFRVNFFESLNDDAATELGPDQAHVLQNLYRERGKLVRRGGSLSLGSGDLYPNQDHDGLGWFRLGTQDVLFAAHNGSVIDWLFSVPATTLSNSLGKLTAGRRTSFVFLDGKVYAADGVLPMIRLTASRADQAMVDNATAPTVANAVDGSGTPLAGVLLATTAYSYRVAFLSADGNAGVASSAVSFTRPGSTGQNRITLPLCGAGQDCSGRRIYRLPQGATVYKVVADVLNNTTTTYDDNVAEASLTLANDGEPNLTNDRMPSCAILEEHQGRLLGAGNTTETLGKQTLFISNYRQPWYSPVVFNDTDPNQGTRIVLQGAAAGEITGVRSHGDKAWVFTSGALHVLVGDEPIDFGLRHFASHGCVSHETICSLQDKLIWLAPDGVYMAAEGQGIGKISEPVRNTLGALTPAQLATCHAFCFDQRYYLMGPTLALVCDFKVRPFVWGEITGTNWRLRTSAAALYQGTRAPRIFGSLAGRARAVELEVGTDDDGAAIPTTIETADLDLGNPGREKRLHLVGAVWKKSTGNATVSVKRGTGETVQTITQDLSEAPVTGGEVCRLQTEVSEYARDEWIRVRVEYAGTGDYQLLSLDGMWSLAT